MPKITELQAATTYTGVELIEIVQNGTNKKIQINQLPINGKSAYELAVLSGFRGSLQEWLTSLQGTLGTTGPMGAQGPMGVQGPIGPQGITGVAGPQGIQGPKGDKGDVGPQGIQGIAGPAGAGTSEEPSPRTEVFQLVITSISKTTAGMYKGYFIAPFDLEIIEMSASVKRDPFNYIEQNNWSTSNVSVIPRLNHTVIQIPNSSEIGISAGLENKFYKLNPGKKAFKGDYISFDISPLEEGKVYMDDDDVKISLAVTVSVIAKVYVRDSGWTRPKRLEWIKCFDTQNIYNVDFVIDPILEVNGYLKFPATSVYSNILLKSNINTLSNDKIIMYFRYQYENTSRINATLSFDNYWLVNSSYYGASSINTPTWMYHEEFKIPNKEYTGVGFIEFVGDNVASGDLVPGSGYITMKENYKNGISNVVGKILYNVSVLGYDTLGIIVFVTEDIVKTNTVINDSIVDAIDLLYYDQNNLPLNTGSRISTLEGATVETNELVNTVIPNFPAPHYTAWYYIKIDSTKTISLDTFGSTYSNPYLCIWRENIGQDDAVTYTYVTGNDDVDVNSNEFQSRIIHILNTGVYYISVDVHNLEVNKQYRLNYTLS